LAHFEHPDFTVAGASFPGIPAILIGVTRHIAWGMTASYTDVQDLVRIVSDDQDPSKYIVDGEKLSFETIEQTYKLGPAEDAQVIKVEWQKTIFGPIVPETYFDTRSAEKYALMWSGFDSSPTVSRVFSGFWDLAQASTLEDVDQAIDRISFSGQNVALAHKSGDIAYRLAALAPLRSAGSNGEIPVLGDSKKKMWNGFLPIKDRPRLDNPSRGYLVAANQRIVEDNGPALKSVGRLAATTSRARRITERIKEALAKGKTDGDTLLSIQQDHVSVSARELAPALGSLCPRTVSNYPEDISLAFCSSIQKFDGAYSIESVGALTYTLYYEALYRSIFSRLLNRKPYSARLHPRYLNILLAQEVKKLARNQKSDLFGARSTEHFLEAAQETLKYLETELGLNAKDWQWGKLHTLTLKGPLSKASVIGGFWEIELGPQAGHSEAPRAEKGLPVSHGAAFRMIAHMTDPPRARMGIDTGNSGHPGHKHFKDQSKNWEDGTPPWMPLTRAEVNAATTMAIILRAPIQK